MQLEFLRRKSNKSQSSFCPPLSCMPRSIWQWSQVCALSSTFLSILADGLKVWTPFFCSYCHARLTSTKSWETFIETMKAHRTLNHSRSPSKLISYSACAAFAPEWPWKWSHSWMNHRNSGSSFWSTHGKVATFLFSPYLDLFRA